MGSPDNAPVTCVVLWSNPVVRVGAVIDGAPCATVTDVPGTVLGRS